VSVRVRVRGIYATALSAVLLQRGFALVEPSPVIQARFGLEPPEGSAEVTVVDRPDGQGVVIEGLREGAAAVVEALRDACPEALFCLSGAVPRRSGGLAALAALTARVEVEFPSVAKRRLDEVRAEVVPTLPGHHYLKAIAPEAVDQAEGGDPNPGALAQRARELREQLVCNTYLPGKEVQVVHLKAGGGFVHSAKFKERKPDGTWVLERHFRAGGLYEGLGVPKEPGDYGFLELGEERWWGRRTYFRRDGTFLGALYNVHTPPEFYPEEVRYLDLEVDVLQRPDGTVEVLDREVLERKVHEGVLPPVLAERAILEAEKLVWALTNSRG